MAFIVRLPGGGGFTSFGDFQNLTRQIPGQLVSLLKIGGWTR